jgi:hypothetical protein
VTSEANGPTRLWDLEHTNAPAHPVTLARNGNGNLRALSDDRRLVAEVGNEESPDLRGATGRLNDPGTNSVVKIWQLNT